MYGDIAYAKSWSGFKHPRGQSSIYVTWREQIKAYMIARHLDPGRLTETQVYSMLLYTRGLSPVKGQIELIKRQHHADDILELNRDPKILVRDSGKKLQTTKECQMAGRDGRGDITEPRVSASHLDSVRPALTSTAGGSCRLGVAIFTASCQNRYCSSI